MLDLRVQVHRRASSARHAGMYTARRGPPVPLALFKCDGSGPLCVPTYTSRRDANVAGVQVKQLFINITKRRY